MVQIFEVDARRHARPASVAVEAVEEERVAVVSLGLSTAATAANAIVPVIGIDGGCDPI